jgi:hypothetical protein
MKTPTTKQARNLIKIALDVNNASHRGSWTDKTTLYPSCRRSVSFMVSDLTVSAVFATLKQIYQDLGYTSPIKVTQSDTNMFERSGGYTYIRAIANLVD